VNTTLEVAGIDCVSVAILDGVPLIDNDTADEIEFMYEDIAERLVEILAIGLCEFENTPDTVETTVTCDDGDESIVTLELSLPLF